MRLRRIEGRGRRAMVLAAALVIVGTLGVHSLAAGRLSAWFGAAEAAQVPVEPIVVVHITPNGIEIPTVYEQLYAGPYLFYLRNRSGSSEDLSLHVTRKGEGEVFAGTLAWGKDVRRHVMLEAGEYVITEDAHPNWEAHVTIKPAR